MNGNLVVLTGNINRPLAEKVCADKRIDVEPANAQVGTFPGGETEIQIKQSVRGCDVFIVQPICENAALNLSPNDALIELLLLMDAARRSSAKRITAVLPYYGYGRQDRKSKPRVPISARIVADMISAAGANRVLLMDLHSNQTQGFFNIPVDHLFSINVFVKYLKQSGVTMVASPDVGNMKMTSAYAKLLEVPFVVIDKRRSSGTESEIINIIGNPEGERIALIDDLISTGGSIANGATALINKGAADVKSIVVHPVLAIKPDKNPKKDINAVQLIEDSPISELIVSDSIPLDGKQTSQKIRILSIAPILAEAIHHIHNDESVSVMFKDADVES